MPWSVKGSRSISNDTLAFIPLLDSLLASVYKGIKAKVSLLIDREPFTDPGIAYDFNDFLKDNK